MLVHVSLCDALVGNTQEGPSTGLDTFHYGRWTPATPAGCHCQSYWLSLCRTINQQGTAARSKPISFPGHQLPAPEHLSPPGSRVNLMGVCRMVNAMLLVLVNPDPKCMLLCTYCVFPAITFYATPWGIWQWLGAWILEAERLRSKTSSATH